MVIYLGGEGGEGSEINNPWNRVGGRSYIFRHILGCQNSVFIKKSLSFWGVSLHYLYIFCLYFFRLTKMSSFS